MTSVDAFYHYYSHFTRDQDYFEPNLAKLTAPVTVVWGSEDLYIKKEMGIELADRVQAKLKLLPGPEPDHKRNPRLGPRGKAALNIGFQVIEGSDTSGRSDFGRVGQLLVIDRTCSDPSSIV